MQLDGYVRVSRVAGREGESFISPDVQRERCAAMASAQGHTIAAWHEDLDLSGAHSNRPGLQAALQRVESGAAKGIIVWKLSRFGRSATDIHRNLERLRSAGGELFTVEEGINTSGAFGRFLLTIMAGLAELEWEQRREGWETARERAVGRGIHIASRTPTGYERGEGGRLVVSNAAPHIRAVFEARAAGKSWRECGAILEAAGVETPYGGKTWSARSLSHVISNRAYLGEARSGEFTLADAHPAIVPADVWERAQRPRGVRYAPKGGRLLSGILRCAGCRYRLKADTMRGRDRSKLVIYRCRKRHALGTCEAPASALASVVEPWVVERFWGRVGRLEVEGVAATEELNDALAELAAAEAELAAYRDSGAASVLGDRFIEGLTVRAERVETAEAAVAELRERADLLPRLTDLESVWPDLSVAERRRVLHGAIDSVFLRSLGRGSHPIEKRALILWRGEGPDGLPGPGRKGIPPRSFDW